MRYSDNGARVCCTHGAAVPTNPGATMTDSQYSGHDLSQWSHWDRGVSVRRHTLHWQSGPVVIILRPTYVRQRGGADAILGTHTQPLPRDKIYFC